MQWNSRVLPTSVLVPEECFWLRSVSSTQKLLTDFLVFVIHEQRSLIIWWCCAMRHKSINRLLLFGTWRVFYWLCSMCCTQTAVTDSLVGAVPEKCSLIPWWCCAMRHKSINRLPCSGTWIVLLIVQCELHQTSINKLSGLSCTWRVTTIYFMRLCNETEEC